MVARQLRVDSDKEEGRKKQIYLIFSLEVEDLQLEAENLQLEAEDLQLEVEELQLEAKDLGEVCPRTEARLETLSRWRKQISTCQVKRYPAENQSEA